MILTSSSKVSGCSLGFGNLEKSGGKTKGSFFSIKNSSPEEAFFCNLKPPHENKNADNVKIPVLDSGENPTATALIRLNGNERFSVRNGFYFNVVQPYQHHTNCPAPGINVYSFNVQLAAMCSAQLSL